MADEHLATAPEHIAELDVWRYGTMPEPTLVDCMVIVRESAVLDDGLNHGVTITFMRGQQTGLWILNHLAPRRLTSVDPDDPRHKAEPAYAPQAFEWWRRRILVKRPALGEASAIVIPNAFELANP